MKMKGNRFIWAAICSSAWFLVAILNSATAALYVENFTNSSGANAAISTVSWNGYYTATATNISTIVTGTGADTWGLSSTYGNPIANGYGYLFTLNGSNSTQIFAATHTFGSAIDMTGQSITWNMGNSATTPKVYVLIQSTDGNWYASSTAYTSTAVFTAGTFNSATSGVSFSLNFSTTAAQWRSFTLTENSTMSLGSLLSSNLVSSTITGIGFYIDYSTAGVGTGNAVRIDTLQIVPEPASLSLLVVAAGLMLIVRIRPRRRNLMSG